MVAEIFEEHKLPENDIILYDKDRKINEIDGSYFIL